jgi:signal peptidase I
MKSVVPLLIIVVTMLVGCGGGGTSTTVKVGDTTVIVNTPNAAGGRERVFRVPAGSMEPTYRIGARVRAKLGAIPTIGAVVVVHPPQGAEQEECGPRPHVVKLDGAACDESIPGEDRGTNFIKRAVAGPGDSIYISEGHVYRRASGSTTVEKERDPYIRECGGSQECNFPISITIPAGAWFLMGDNRGESDDSRFWGPVPAAWIVGVVTGTE